MPLVAPNFFGLIDDTNPIGTDSRTDSDNQHKNIITSLKAQCPNWTGVVNATQGEVNMLAGYEASFSKPMPGQGNITVCYFYNATVPTGWTPAPPDDNLRNLTIAPGGATPVGAGTIDGDGDPSGPTLDVTVNNVTVDLPATTGGHALTEDENGPHRHAQNGMEDSGANTFRSIIANTSLSVAQNGNVNTDLSGLGTPHDHPLGGTASQTAGSGTGSTAAFNPRRAIGLLGRLNA